MPKTRIERAVESLMRKARQALYAEERYHYWHQFGTGSNRSRSADARREKALADLERAEAEAEEALLQLSVDP